MKIFISFRFTGEDVEILKITLDKIKEIFESRGHDIFCSLYEDDFFKSKNFSVDEIYDYCNQKLKDYETILFFIKSSEPSKGMEMELDRAIKHNKKIIIAIQKNLNFTKFRTNAHKIIEYTDLEHLYTLLKRI